MTDCEFLKKCLFFNDKLENMPKAADMMKETYCQWRYTECARYKIANVLGKSAVPHDVFPSDDRRATKILINHDMK